MSEINTGGPAFPSAAHQNVKEGMTMRDYFAAKAMQAHICASMSVLSKAYANDPDAVNPITAEAAYEIADAMIAARKKGSAK